MKLRSPNEIFEAAKRIMLDGKDPVSEYDWALIANFAAVNIHESVGSAALKFFMMIYNSPLDEEYLEGCWNYHNKQTIEEKA